MKELFRGRSLYVIIAVGVIAFVLSMLFGIGKSNNEELVTTTVETGAVRQLVSVSGVAEAEQTAELAFSVSGIVRSVNVEKGTEVSAGDVLIELDARDLLADRQDAAAALAKAIADRDELLAGPTNQARSVTSETVLTKEEALKTTIENEERKVENAYRNLLSANLLAYSVDDDEDAVPPVISGTYNCETEGIYTIEVFNSGSESGFSYNLTGLESDTQIVSTDQAAPMGSCGLRAQFTEGSRYSRSVWEVPVPNTRSTNYVSNKNAFELAVTQAESAIALAEQDVALAIANAENDNAPARSEAITRANAAITQAQARLARIDAEIADHTLIAPFSGTITEIDILPGETVTTVPVVTLLASGAFEVTARIPEIDIGKLLIGQRSELVFDARSNETLTGETEFISLKATEIDGVAYYEAVIELDETPAWLRSGLNADIEIIITEETETLRVPKRFVTETETGYIVLKRNEDGFASTTIEIILEGNDGFVAITGLNVGDILVAP